jgi:hypothetical protein
MSLALSPRFPPHWYLLCTKTISLSAENLYQNALDKFHMRVDNVCTCDCLLLDMNDSIETWATFTLYWTIFCRL